MTERRLMEGFELERVGDGDYHVFRDGERLGRIQLGVNGSWYARTESQLRAGRLGGNWHEVGKVIADAYWLLLARAGKCTGLTGHIPGSDHRWQECPTYHD